MRKAVPVWSIACTQFSYSSAGEDLNFILDIMGKPDKVDQFISLMVPLGLLEVARTGVAGITRGAEAMKV